jgi:uncharacterized membrane protein YeaQ/YmgE (transglycosylase-associated protein family)
MNVVLWLAAGAAIGLLASGGAATRNAIVVNVLTGIVGAVLTGWLLSGLFAPPRVDHVSLPGLLVSLLGAGLLLPLVHTVRSMMD